MGFSEDIDRFIAKIETGVPGLLAASAALAKTSIVEGSEITGAPGQPVDTGNLKNSWQLEFLSPTEAMISTNVDYARPIEDGVGPNGPMTLRSAVGGFHSVALTMNGFDRIVAEANRQLNGTDAG